MKKNKEKSVELSIEEKKKILFEYASKKGMSIRDAQKELESLNWNVESSSNSPKIETKEKKIRKSKKKEKETSDEFVDESSSSENDIISKDEEKIKEDFSDFDFYLKRCKNQNKKNAVIPKIDIGKGFYTMKEIVENTRSMKSYVNSSIENLHKFNKHNNTSFSSWKDMSLDPRYFPEEELIKYENEILWYHWSECHDPSTLSKKTYKELKDRFLHSKVISSKNSEKY